ncbi:uncharacterized protein MYCGRDRAFT_71228 [Zymoseptoria tritici IPO323]|uniref:Uncharacterized protein n=1 Tax=Zymoseptoria tritici (strain CBS 115943 / IPO323) TaxID=336722 RepID=F9X8J3_ZYMTI|nr:uncharacterized protein MYCGRDRAFT_71228 [Zymoseptoria tritici IPO323]EGP88355.1 hypothetical protein MYCGRDRAFT_71228 [Zymoseptoria tritici IPO323]
MLDENLPAFFLKPSATKIPHHRDIYLSHHGSEPSPFYVIQNSDPTSQLPAHRNVYAAALFDAYNPSVLFGEVLVRPAWSQPTLNAEEIRRNNGITPPPVPLLPNEFVVQLYNPEQQVRVEVKEGKWGASDSYEFAMPQTSFRTPSASNLDRGQSDPASLAITPKVNFVWRREGKLSKDLTCFMTGKSTDTVAAKKSKHRDPDIAIALWRSMREMTIYESNLGRVLEDMEDPKGLEVALLLGAVVIKDLYFGIKGQSEMKEVFNISELPEERKLSGGGRKVVSPPKAGIAAPPPPPKAAARRKKEREKADEAERKRLLKVVEEEAKQARKKAAEVERETERLRRLYGTQGQANSSQLRIPQQQPVVDPRLRRPASAQGSYGQARPPWSGSASSSALVMSGANGVVMSGGGGPGQRPPAVKPKKSSFFGLMSGK